MQVLGTRALNRALLARQLLLRRASLSPLQAVRHLCGLQAQAPFPPYYGLWSRLQGFAPEDLGRLLLDRAVVRIVLMRGTVHLVTAEDCLSLRPLVQSIMDRDLRSNTLHASHLRGLDFAQVATAVKELLAEGPRTGAELGRLLARRWPDREPASLGYAARGLVPLVQVPPRAVWGRSGKPAYATAEAWIGRPLDESASRRELVLRYLAAFGPATVRDIQAWSGLTRLGAVVEALRPQLCTFTTEQGQEVVDVPDAPRPDPDTPASPRFIAEFDNLLLAHADRTRVLPEQARQRVFASRNGAVPGTVLVDGFVCGTWRTTGGRGSTALDIELYRRVSTKDTAALENAGAELLRFAAPHDRHEVRFVLQV
jgi:Winged helix DNA-binding domain